MLAYDTIVFDLDGTLTESEPGIVASVQYALQAMGRSGFDDASLRCFVGPPLLKSFQSVTGMSPEEAAMAVVKFRERYARGGWMENSVYPGIPALLRALKANGAYVALATSKPIDFAQRIVDAFGLTRYFDAISAPVGEESDHRKIGLLRRALPAQPGRACMIGDRIMDIDAAVEAGVDGIAVGYGYGPLSEFTSAVKVVPSVQALSDFLLGDTPRPRGFFLSLEGADGCGKSTQAGLLAKWLIQRGHEVVCTREPGGCPISERIRQIVLSKDDADMRMTDVCEALLFAASRAQHVADVVKPALAAGKVVLCDRFVDSSVAYQGVGRGLGEHYVRSINERAVDGCVPDMTLCLAMDPNAALDRRVRAETPDRIEKADRAMVARIADAFLRMAEAEPARIRVVDAEGAPETVFERCKTIVSEVL